MALSHADARRFVKFLSPVAHPDGCWIWTGALTTGKTVRTRGGYGKFSLRDRNCLSHRVMYEHARGPISGTIDHLCRNRACCNPAHLEDVPNRTNLLRGQGIMAQHARKTHCKRGHPLAGHNLMLVPGGRMCRECRNWSFATYRERKRAKRQAITGRTED